MIVKQWTAQDLEALRRRIVAEHEQCLPTVAEGDEVLAVFAELDRARVESEQLRDALRAVYEALDVPYAASEGDAEVRADLVDVRAGLAKRMLARLTYPEAHANVAEEVEELRAELAEHPPVGYVTDEQARAARAAGKSYKESVTPPAEPSPVEELAATDEPAPDALPAGDPSPAAVAGVLRLVAGLLPHIGLHQYGLLGSLDEASIRSARAIEQTDGLEASREYARLLAAAARGALLGHIGAAAPDPALLARWAQGHTVEHIRAVMRAAADRLDGSAS
ncbi:hypothetical protein ACBJ59_61125 [Nonomuraea sp. MTCD27]|uniref:hypothetical protein n=1 Tax=Nonomuraea sp. MTCD27 TaxID=1676747 RepID=UPI0035C05F2F